MKFVDFENKPLREGDEVIVSRSGYAGTPYLVRAVIVRFVNAHIRLERINGHQWTRPFYASQFSKAVK